MSPTKEKLLGLESRLYASVIAKDTNHYISFSLSATDAFTYSNPKSFGEQAQEREEGEGQQNPNLEDERRLEYQQRIGMDELFDIYQNTDGSHQLRLFGMDDPEVG